MRSEIFDRIKQNKINYYSELKNQDKIQFSNPEKIKSGNEKMNHNQERKDSLKKGEVTVEWSIPDINLQHIGKYFSRVPGKFQKAVKSTGNQSIAAYNHIAAVSNSVVQSSAAKSVKKGIHMQGKKIHKINETLNRKVAAQTEKIAQGIYDISSKLFEDNL